MIKTRLIGFGFYLLAALSTNLFAYNMDSSGNRPAKEGLHVYLLIGQSNMAGRAPFTEEESRVVERCYLLNDKDQWEPAKNPFNRHSTIGKELHMQRMNPGYGFAQTMLKQNKDISIGLVVNARGGTKIEEWKKGTEFYNEAVKRAKEAQKTGTLKGVLWHQGESNSKHPEGYLDKLGRLIADLREDLGVADLPFVAGQINDAGEGGIDVSIINDQIAKLPETVESTGVVYSEGLVAMDRWHFNAESMKLLGESYAEATLKVQAEQKNGDNFGQ